MTFRYTFFLAHPVLPVHVQSAHYTDCHNNINERTLYELTEKNPVARDVARVSSVHMCHIY